LKKDIIIIKFDAILCTELIHNHFKLYSILWAPYLKRLNVDMHLPCL